MNRELLKQKLLAAARAQEALDRVPLAFEKRVMARLFGRPPHDAWAAWSALLWRAVAPCCAAMVLVAASSLALTPPGEDLDDQLDAVLLADLDTSSETP